MLTISDRASSPRPRCPARRPRGRRSARTRRRCAPSRCARAVHQRRRAGLERERRAVVPGAEAAELDRQPERGVGRQQRLHARRVDRRLGRVDLGVPAERRRVLGQPRVGVAPAAQEALDLRLRVRASSRARRPARAGSARRASISARSGIVTCQPASATKRGRDDVRRVEQRVAQSAARCATRRAAGRRRRAGGGALSIAFTAPPSRQCGCSCSAWPARPAHLDRAVDGSAAGRPDLERARLGDDREVGGDAVARAGQPADAAGLLVGVRAHERGRRASAPRRGQRLGRDDHRRDPALHVARAAADDRPVAHLGVERIVRPSRPRAARARRRCAR